MPEYRLIDNRRKGGALAKEMSASLEGFHSALLKMLADEVVGLSPVDTGTYMDNHSMHSGRKQRPRVDSSHGKPGGQDYSTYADAARSRLYGDIESTKAGDEVFVSNTAVHAPAVEYGGHNWKRGPYAVYRTARSRIAVLSKKAADIARGGL